MYKVLWSAQYVSRSYAFPQKNNFEMTSLAQGQMAYQLMNRKLKSARKLVEEDPSFRIIIPLNDKATFASSR